MASSGDAQAAPPPADKGDDPFGRFAIASHAPLEALTTRQPCAGCSKTRKYFCYDCLTPMGDPAAVPRVALPCDVHVIKHPQEQNSKSTGVHAPVLSDARLFSYSADAPLPEYDPATTVLLFPSPTSRSLQEMGPELAAVRTAIIVDCTWSQAMGILSDTRLSSLPHVSM
jgi:DTW domain-containing protein YfiP